MPGFHDFDGDNYKDSIETYLGTDPTDECSFPMDVDDSGSVNIIDVLALKPPFNTSAAGDDEAYIARVDFNVDEAISIIDVLAIDPWFGEACPYPDDPFVGLVLLREEIGHIPWAPVWFQDVAAVTVETNQVGEPTCEEVALVADHWSNLTHFTFLVDTANPPNCAETSDVGVFFDWIALSSPDNPAEVRLYQPYPTECQSFNPCHFPDYAKVIMNANHFQMTSDPEYRHLVLTHELGHVIGQGQTGGPCVSSWSIMLDGSCLELLDEIHYPRPNDVVFTNIKY